MIPGHNRSSASDPLTYSGTSHELVERDGHLNVTVPSLMETDPTDLAQALSAA
jgi:hypothetical protein